MGNAIVERSNAFCQSVFQFHVPGSLCVRKTSSVLSSVFEYFDCLSVYYKEVS